MISGIDIPKEGFVFTKEELPRELELLMRKIGFNEKETSDFLAYWLPRLQEKPYYFLTLLPEEEIKEKEKLVFSQEPDTIIRARFVFEGLNEPILVKSLSIPHYERKGFVVADWGGTPWQKLPRRNKSRINSPIRHGI